MSIIDTPVFQALSFGIFASAVTSSKCSLPLLRYKILLPWLEQKNKSIRPSLLKSPAPTPAPL